MTRVPGATYRLQLHGGPTFAAAADLVGYLDDLGITDCYVSPVFRARRGSAHGYDVVDHGSLDPELGTEEDFGRFAARLREKGMGLLLDMVPNHMCIASSENRWWNDVLENGPSSLYARHFDIDWSPPKSDLADKVLLPFLGDQYGRVLENQEIQAVREAGTFFAQYYDSRFPLAPQTWIPILEAALAPVREAHGEEHAAVLEVASIITALSHLPLPGETEPARVQERQREKEVVKRRLAALIEASPEMGVALDAVLQRLNGRRGQPHSFDELEALLAAQAYRLSHWRVATDEINYRRFFDVNELAALRVEDAAVFDALHALPSRLIERADVTGLRIDHVDGLFDPPDYLRRLPSGCYTVVEKVLIGDERLRADWPVAGTTGYELLNRLNGLFVDSSAADPLRDLYGRFTGALRDFQDIIYESKKLVMSVAMSSELTVLARRLDRISEQHRFSRDFTLNSLQDGLAEVVACFPVYRSYVRAADGSLGPEDRRHILRALRLAKRRNPAISESLFDFIGSILLLAHPETLDERQREERREFVMRFQQLTGPVTAKGVEDTACYRYYPLASLNEVGGDPDDFGISVERFHLENIQRQRNWPHGLSATSTHDTKRSEDVRARLNVLSEIPGRWEQAVWRWREINRASKARIDDEDVPDANEEYLFYQTLVGAWPPGWRTVVDASLVERMQAYMRKAAREAKLHTSWINPNEAHERGVADFVAAVLDPAGSFLESFTAFVASILRPGLLNSVSQTLLKIASPGVPDFYQGTELFEFQLVDPDNRRAVDFARRRDLLSELAARTRAGEVERLADELLARLEEGPLKMFVTRQALRFRRQRRELFDGGDYVPLQAAGPRQREVVAFARTTQGHAVVAAAGRFFTHLPPTPTGAAAWGDSALMAHRGAVYHEVLTQRELRAQRSGGGFELPLAEVFAHLPVAMLERIA